MSKITEYFLISESKFLELLSQSLRNLKSIDSEYLKNFYEIYQEKNNGTPDFCFLTLIENNSNTEKEFFYGLFLVDSEGISMDFNRLEKLVKKNLEKTKRFENISILKSLCCFTDLYSPYEIQSLYFDFILQNIKGKSKLVH